MSVSNVAFTIFLAGTASLAIAQNGPLTVCQMLDSMSNRQELTVRAQIAGEPHHGFFLSEGTNGDPCPGWRRRFLTAPSAVGLEFFSSRGVYLTEEQQRSNRALLERLIALSRDAPLRDHWVTLTGVAVKSPWSLVYRRGDGTYASMSPDPYGWMPAWFVIKTVREEAGPHR